METIAATEASNRFGHLLDISRLEPVTIEKQGRGVAVILSLEEYQRMEHELGMLDDLRLRESIAEASAGKTREASQVFEGLDSIN